MIIKKKWNKQEITNKKLEFLADLMNATKNNELYYLKVNKYFKI